MFDDDCTAYVFSRAVQECQKAMVKAILHSETFCYKWDSALCESLIAMVNYKDLNCPQTSSIESGLLVQMAVFDDIVSTVITGPCVLKSVDGGIEHIRTKIDVWNKQLMELSTHDCLFSRKFLEHVYKTYTKHRRYYDWPERDTFQDMFQKSRNVKVWSDRPLLYVLACVPILVDLQNEALKIVVREGRWEVIRHANLFYIWEPVRRVLFREAVEQEQWALVSQLADHALYDDQRLFAVEEAYIHKQWDVMLKLSDFGLTEAERMHVYRRLLLHADMQTIHKIFEREDIGRLVELCGSRGRKMQAEDFVKLAQMKSKLVQLQQTFASSSDTLETVLRRKHWGLALFRLKRKKSHSWNVDVLPVIKAAMRANAIHVTKALLTHETVSQARRDSLLPVMVKCRQWAACRALLEGGVSAALHEQVLPQLMEARQWLLLARLLEFELSTQSRESIFNFALDNREGTVVTMYLETMQTPLTMELRQYVFRRSVEFGVWQALQHLIRFTDDEGLKVRDKAMTLAIENKQWDIVDCCLLRGADLDNHKDEEGHTFLQIRAKEHEWTDVEKLVERGAVHDMYYVSSSNTSAPTYTILHRAIEDCRWKTVKLLIQFYGDLNRPDPYTSETPLQMLTDLNCADLIEETLFWGCDVTKGVTKRGRTTLHAVCEAGRWETMYYLIARGVDPLGVTENGQSVLMCAVLNQDCPDTMVAECIRLGLSTYQPYITETQYELLDETLKNMASSSRNDTGQVRASPQQIHFRTSESFSPFQHAVFRNLPRVQNMLYESGACSYTELWRYCTDLEKCSEVSFCHDIARDLPNLQTLASTPRTLQSSCRLVISHNISECCKRRCYQRNVQSLLPILTDYFARYRCTGSEGKWIELKKWNEEEFVKYLQFDDLTRLCVKEQPD